MNAFGLLYPTVQNETIIAKVSAHLSRREIDNVNLAERVHYFSESKSRTFLEAIDLEVPIAKKLTLKGKLGCDNHIKADVEGDREISYKISLYREVKKAIDLAKKKGIIVPYEKSRRGKYILIHFPLYNGTMKLKTCKKYDDVYWWCGEYRDLKVYACGNKKNRIDDTTAIVEPLWNPSATSASKEFFDNINTYVSETDEEIIVEPENIFEMLSCNLHEGTMRGYKERPYQGWHVILLRCDQVSRDYGCTEIFGSPVFVSYETPSGYGWYYVCEDNNKKYYVEHYANRRCHWLETNDFNCGGAFEKIKIRNKSYIGYNYGYHMFKIGQSEKMRIKEMVSLVPQKETERIMERECYEEIISRIGGLRTVGLTTGELLKCILKS